MSIEKRLNYKFKSEALLKEALSHPSLSSEIRPAPPDNQRLEYLGDAVVELVVSSHLYHHFPEFQEGILTQLRASVVSKPALATAARAIDLGSALFMSNGEAGSGGRDRDSNLADALEAILGAIYLDGGLESAREVALQLLGAQLEELNPKQAQGNSKGELQEILQQLNPESPVYKVVSEEGPPHDRTFVCEVTWKGQTLGQGRGPSKKSAEAEAAQVALAARIWSTRRESS
ncbi:ribonuclease III [Akkermansiaceae bacterium]|nr:ribonuclease III [Akkermansiaceae bacterium]MDB4464841.1 ribonuclease III [Akkermansiaceae bacterium]MDB4466176.1 ribonuclease III [bacterium]